MYTCSTDYSVNDSIQKAALLTRNEQTPLNRMSTVTGTVQTTYWLNQANLTTREQLDNREWVTDGKGEGDKFPVN